MASRYEHHPAAFRAEVLKAGFMQEMVDSRAHRIEAVAVAASPTGDPENPWYRKSRENVGDPGTYKASWEVTPTPRGDRACARVANTSNRAFYVEYGTYLVPRYRTLGKAMHAGGGIVKGGSE